MKIRELIDRKHVRKVVTATADESIASAVQKLADWHIGCLIIMDGDSPVGIMNERDVVRCLASKGMNEDIKVEDAMSKGLRFVEPEDSIQYATKVMHQKGIRHLPVIENNRIVHVLSFRDIVLADADELETEVKQLMDYIAC